jgi:LSD1 subclass zinc finger protein
MNTEETEVSRKFPCNSCGAFLIYAPGTDHLKCGYCGTENTIEARIENIEELDFEEHIKKAEKAAPKIELYVVKCEGCGAETTLKENITADECAFCATPVLVKYADLKEEIKPRSILPFQIDKKRCESLFGSWIAGRWFAPNDLKKLAVRDKIRGMYIPYWTFDFAATTKYTGSRGEDYTSTETYTTTENGRSVTRTRTVIKTRWYRAWGTVKNFFNDVLVTASRSLPADYACKLEPWDLSKLVPYEEKYMAGFICESYQISLREGIEVAKRIADETITESIRRDIGGDHQRIDSMSSTYTDVTFKHTLLPIWLSSYRYRGKVYQFLINGQTGEVQGERPLSWIKITLLVIAIIIIGVGIYLFTEGS